MFRFFKKVVYALEVVFLANICRLLMIHNRAGKLVFANQEGAKNLDKNKQKNEKHSKISFPQFNN